MFGWTFYFDCQFHAGKVVDNLAGVDVDPVLGTRGVCGTYAVFAFDVSVYPLHT